MKIIIDIPDELPSWANTMMIDFQGWEEDIWHDTEVCSYHKVSDLVKYVTDGSSNEGVTYLTTTQSAPSVGSVPTDDNQVKNVINGWKKSWSVKLSSRSEGALRDRIEKLLTSRTEGKL